VVVVVVGYFGESNCGSVGRFFCSKRHFGLSRLFRSLHGYVNARSTIVNIHKTETNLFLIGETSCGLFTGLYLFLLTLTCLFFLTLQLCVCVCVCDELHEKPIISNTQTKIKPDAPNER
jgi:hypothetical protein